MITLTDGYLIQMETSSTQKEKNITPTFKERICSFQIPKQRKKNIWNIYLERRNNYEKNKPTDKNISPNQRLRMMELSGIPITEREKKKMK